MNDEWAVYCIRNIENGRVYVGCTADWHRRKNAHKSLLRNGGHVSKPLQKDWNEFGKDAFEFTVLEIIQDRNPTALSHAERKWIEDLHARDPAKGYNKCFSRRTDRPEMPCRIIVPLPDDLLEQVDDYRFSNRSPSRAAAIRELLEIALTVQTKDQSQ